MDSYLINLWLNPQSFSLLFYGNIYFHWTPTDFADNQHFCLFTTGEKLNESSAPDVRELCNTLMNAYLIQLLDTGFLHADPHPGNLIRTPEGKICIVDFGLMTYVSKEQRDNLVDYIAKLTTEDWEGVARALAGLGFIPEGAPDPVESGLVEPLGAVFSQLVKGGGAQDMAKRLKANTNIDQVSPRENEAS